MAEAADNLLRIEEVAERINFSTAWVYDRLDKKSARHDPTFPRQIKIGKNSRWRASEIDAWLASFTAVGGESVNKVPFVANPDQDQLAVERASEIQRAQADGFEEKRVATIRQLLEASARNGALIRYSELMAATMLSSDHPDDWQTIDRIIASISKASHLENQVLLGAHVREYKGSEGIPRDAFFELAQSLGYQCADRKAFAETQLLVLFAHYKNPNYRTAKNLQWVEARGKSFLICPEQSA